MGKYIHEEEKSLKKKFMLLDSNSKPTNFKTLRYEQDSSFASEDDPLDVPGNMFFRIVFHFYNKPEENGPSYSTGLLGLPKLYKRQGEPTDRMSQPKGLENIEPVKKETIADTISKSLNLSMSQCELLYNVMGQTPLWGSQIIPIPMFGNTPAPSPFAEENRYDYYNLKTVIRDSTNKDNYLILMPDKNFWQLNDGGVKIYAKYDDKTESSKPKSELPIPPVRTLKAVPKLLKTTSSGGYNSNCKIIFDFLTSEIGLTEVLACGFLGIIKQESEFNPKAVNLYEKGAYGHTNGKVYSNGKCVGSYRPKGYGAGICQWTNTGNSDSTGRKTNVLLGVGLNENNKIEEQPLSTQLKMIKYELTDSKGGKNGLLPKLKSCNTITDAVDVVLRGFENGGNGVLASIAHMNGYTWDGGYKGAMQKRVNGAISAMKINNVNGPIGEIKSGGNYSEYNNEYGGYTGADKGPQWIGLKDPSEYIKRRKCEFEPLGLKAKPRDPNRSKIEGTVQWKFEQPDQRYVDDVLYSIDLNASDYYETFLPGVSNKMQIADQGILYDLPNAWSYLVSNDEDERALMLLKFIYLLLNLTWSCPWYFQKITGLDAAVERKVVMEDEFKFSEEQQKISITCLPDAIDNRIGTLLDMYRSIVFSWADKREILPANLRKFDMSIYIFQQDLNSYRNQTREGDTVKSQIAPYKESLNQSTFTNNGFYSYKYFELHNCEFDYDSSKSGYTDINNSIGFNPEQTIDILFDDMYESRYNQWTGLNMGDMLKADLNEYFGLNDLTLSDETAILKLRLLNAYILNDTDTINELEKNDSLGDISGLYDLLDGKAKEILDNNKNIWNRLGEAALGYGKKVITKMSKDIIDKGLNLAGDLIDKGIHEITKGDGTFAMYMKNTFNTLGINGESITGELVNYAKDNGFSEEQIDNFAGGLLDTVVKGGNFKENVKNQKSYENPENLGDAIKDVINENIDNFTNGLFKNTKMNDILGKSIDYGLDNLGKNIGGTVDKLIDNIYTENLYLSDDENSNAMNNLLNSVFKGAVQTLGDKIEDATGINTVPNTPDRFDQYEQFKDNTRPKSPGMSLTEEDEKRLNKIYPKDELVANVGLGGNLNDRK